MKKLLPAFIFVVAFTWVIVQALNRLEKPNDGVTNTYLVDEWMPC